MISLDALNALDDPDACVMPIDRALSQFPGLSLSELESDELRFGRTLADRSEGAGRYRLYATDGRFVGLGLVEATVLRADRLMATSGVSS